MALPGSPGPPSLPKAQGSWSSPAGQAEQGAGDAMLVRGPAPRLGCTVQVLRGAPGKAPYHLAKNTQTLCRGQELLLW